MSLDKWWNDVNCVYFNKLYFIHMICISMLFRFSLLVRNVIIHSPCDICVTFLFHPDFFFFFLISLFGRVISKNFSMALRSSIATFESLFSSLSTFSFSCFSISQVLLFMVCFSLRIFYAAFIIPCLF